MATKTSSGMTAFSPAERRNWGYWDGRSARERNRHPEWCKSYHHRPAHPFNKPYGEGFWAGWYGEAHPNTGEVPA